MMNESNNACCVPQEAPAILSVTEENEKITELANRHLENILRRLRGDRPIPQADGYRAEPASGTLRSLTENQQRLLNRLTCNIDELDNLI